MYREGTKNYYYVNAYETIWKKWKFVHQNK